METLAALPLKSEYFDREVKAYDDATTWLAETLNGRMRTPFEYAYDGRELYARSGEPLKPFFEKGLEDSRNLAEASPSLSFELRRRQIEMDEYEDMLKMARGELGNTMVVVSDFPPELMGATKDIGGYNTERKQTMLRVITRGGSGRIKMQSQSLDGSNRGALEAIYTGFGLKPTGGELLGQRIYDNQDEAEQEFLIDRLTGVYDHSLAAQNPGRHYRAGRLEPDCPGVDTYQFVCQQSDLVDYLTGKMLDGEMDEQVMFSVAATMASRYELGSDVDSLPSVAPSELKQALIDEIRQATVQASDSGMVFSGCGASVGPSGEIGAGDELGSSGFGNRSSVDDCEFTSKECPKCHKKNVKTVAKNGKFYGACGCHS